MADTFFPEEWRIRTMRRNFIFLCIVLFLYLMSWAPLAAVKAGDGTDAVTWRYEFAASSGTYTEITGGTVHGTVSNDDQSFNAVALGFPFTFDGVDYDASAFSPTGSSLWVRRSRRRTRRSVPALRTMSSSLWVEIYRVTVRHPN